MKNILFFIIGLSFLFYCNTGLCIEAPDNQTGVQSNAPSEGVVTIMSSEELNALTTNWAQEYGRLNPGTTINIASLTGDFGKEDLRFVTDQYSQTVNEEKAWKMVVGHEAIVAIVNVQNPMWELIKSQGVSADELARLFSDPEKRNWKSILNGGANAPINFYMIDNAEVSVGFGKFAGINNPNLVGNTVVTADELVSAIRKDVYAIGFCKLTDVRDAAAKTLVPNIQLLPIDKNKNGRIDSIENIYASVDAFTRGIWIGKYPHELCGSIYAVSSTKPTNENALAFLSWVTTDGRKFLSQNGYSDLAGREVKSNMAALAGPVLAVAQNEDKFFISNTWLLLMFGLTVLALVAAALVSYGRDQKLNALNKDMEITPALNENTILAPKGLYFDKTHTWTFMEKDGMVKMGIDDFLQHITGTLTRINMKNTGEKVRKGEVILTVIRDGKQLNIYAPISGIIREQNKSLLTNTALLNTSTFTEGWVYVIEPMNWVREIQFLFMGEKYTEWLSDEFTRLKDFFAESVRSNTEVYTHIILQDGGEITDNVLADMGPEVWEDFQTKFIDTSK